MTYPLTISGELWIFSKQCKLPADADAVLERMKSAGYTNVECSPGDVSPEQLARHGMKMTSAHTLMPALLEPQKLIDQLLACDCRSLAISGLHDWHQRSADDYRRGAETLNKVAPSLADAGIRVHYHNHDFEFAQVAGKQSGYDLLTSLTSQDVLLCIDVGWVFYAGLDPFALLQRHGPRIGMVHLRDFDGKESVALGRGKMPVLELAKVSRRQLIIRHLIVEQDPPATADPAAEMAASLTYLRQCLPSIA